MRFLFFVLAVAVITLYYFLHVVKMCTVFVYPIDDAYIHLAMAKNFAFEGIWSPQTKYSFMSSSSSPGFVLILSLFFRIFGNHELIPIYLNIVIFILLVFFAHKYFLNSYNTIIYIIFSFFFVSLFLPHNQIITGMEHLFHCLFMLLSFKKLHDLLLNNFMRNDIILFCFFTALATLFRFETLFYISAVCFGLIIYTKKLKLAFAIAVISSLPFIIYGFISLHNGAYFLSNSLLTKSSFFIVNGNWYLKLIKILYLYFLKIINGNILFLFSLSAFCIFFYMKSKDLLSRILLFTVLITFLIHGFFAQFGWLFRYETYLVLMFLILVHNFFQTYYNTYIKQKLLLLFIFVILFTQSIYRFYICDKTIKLASVNINHQQISMSKFIGKYYNNSNIIINDIGAISYYTKAKYIDLYGLASPHILNYKFNTNDKKFLNFPYLIEKEATETKVSLVCIYDNSLKKIPASWQKVASWQIINNIACGRGTVYFFGINKKQYSEIYNYLKAFQNELNPTINVKYF